MSGEVTATKGTTTPMQRSKTRLKLKATPLLQKQAIRPQSGMTTIGTLRLLVHLATGSEDP